MQFLLCNFFVSLQPHIAEDMFIIAGIVTATNKFIDADYLEKLKEWIKMTRVARLFEEEKVEAVNVAINETEKSVRKQIAKNMLLRGNDILYIMQITGLTRLEVDEVQASGQA